MGFNPGKYLYLIKLKTDYKCNTINIETNWSTQAKFYTTNWACLFSVRMNLNEIGCEDPSDPG
jgi:hypothetical protein